MQVQYYKAFWGMSEPMPARIDRILAAGYFGFETAVGEVLAARKEGYKTPAIGMLYLEDVDALRKGLDQAGEAKVEAVNVHAGKDWWDFDRGSKFFEGALRAVADSGLTVTFETHRARLLFEPQSTMAYLKRFPELRITADFSHWTCVCSSMLQDQPEALALAIERTALIHARVGHEQGPQVPDPRSATWEPYVKRFEAWWDLIKKAHEARGETVLRVDPEFGPPHYMWTDPDHNDRPLADLFDVCLSTMLRLKEKWK